MYGDTVEVFSCVISTKTTKLMCIIIRTSDISLFFHSTNSMFIVTTCEILYCAVADPVSFWFVMDKQYNSSLIVLSA